MPEHDSASVLEAYGVRFAERRRAATPDEAAAAAEDVGYPVVVKVDGPAHKGSVDGVALDLRSGPEVAAAAARMGGRVLVARQLSRGVEVLCGMTRDVQYGPVVVVGLGGRAAEALSLAAVALAPLEASEAVALVARAPGLAAVATEAALAELATVASALARLAVDQPSIEEIDVNPLILTEDGAVAVDALLVVASAAPTDAGEG
jgi:acetyltransferase